MRGETPGKFLLFSFCFSSLLAAQATAVDLTRLSLEELMNVEVSLASRKPEQLGATAAAVAVISAEDLRRSGARSIPEALRLVPGMQVARIDANKWAVTARGFAGLFANKLLVLVDDRSVYTPLFSGVFWEAQDVILEDVERIEVIRGPGGTLWGTNAVNGIINVVTKKTADTQGGLMQLGGGTAERRFGAVRYGGRLAEGIYYRGYAKFFERDSSPGAASHKPQDGWHVTRAGGRLDYRLSTRDALTAQGDFYTGQVGQSLELVTSLTPPQPEIVHADAVIEGFSFIGRWERTLNENTDLALKLYHDRSERADVVLHGAIDNTDVDFQHRFRLRRRLEIIWGLGYRSTRDDFAGTFTMSLIPASRRTHLFSGFAHGDIFLLPERLRLSLGSKIERNSYTGFELQPNVRLWWSPVPEHVFWGALSRAARIPSRGESDLRGIARAMPPDALFPGSPVALVALLGNRHYGSEKLVAAELGYRTLRGEITLDLTAFYHLYDQLRTNELGLPVREQTPSPPHLLVPLQVDNKARGIICGWEWAANWQRWQRWHLRAVYSYLQMDLELEEESRDEVTKSFAGEIPHHQFSLRSHLELYAGLELDVIGRFVDDLASMDIPRYLTGDLRLGWRSDERLELSLVGRNLLDSPHREFVSTSSGALPTAVEASVHALLTWKY